MTDLIVLGRTGTDGTVIGARMKCRVAGDNCHQSILILPVMTMMKMMTPGTMKMMMILIYFTQGAACCDG